VQGWQRESKGEGKQRNIQILRMLAIKKTLIHLRRSPGIAPARRTI